MLLMHVLTCRYFCSWLVDSKVPLLQRVGKITNSARKDIFAALQWAHFLCITSALVLVSPAVHNAINRLLPDAVWSVTAGIDSVAIEWLNRSVPFVLVTSICLQLLGSIEVGHACTHTLHTWGLLLSFSQALSMGRLRCTHSRMHFEHG